MHSQTVCAWFSCGRKQSGSLALSLLNLPTMEQHGEIKPGIRLSWAWQHLVVYLVHFVMSISVEQDYYTGGIMAVYFMAKQKHPSQSFPNIIRWNI